MNEFKVWIEDENDEPYLVKAFDAETAAADAVEERHADLDYPEEIDVRVMDEQGIETHWTVTVEMRPHFSATEKKESGNG